MNIKLEDIIDSYLEYCTDDEWKELLNKYNVEDNENYMGEVRKKLEESILNSYDFLEKDQQNEMLDFFNKYNKDGILQTYNVEIVETLSRVVEQKGRSYEDACERVQTKYSDEDIVLDWNDLEKTEYKEYPSPKIKEDFVIIVDFDKNKKDVYISTESSSGATYKCKTLEDLKNAVNTYFDNYIILEDEKQNPVDKALNQAKEELIKVFKELEKQNIKERARIGREFKKKQQEEMER